MAGASIIEGVREDVAHILDAMHAVRRVQAVLAHHVRQAEAWQPLSHVGVKCLVHREARLAIAFADAARLRLGPRPWGVWVNVAAAQALSRLIECAWPVLVSLTPLMHGEEDKQRSRLEGEEHPRSALDGTVVKVEGHRAEFKDDHVQGGWKMGEEARQRVLRRSRIKRRVVDLVARVRV